MMKTKLILFAIFNVFLSNIFSQEIKYYSGSYSEENYAIRGDAKYYYYEDENFNRILDGDFNFSQGTSLVIKGKFEGNKRIGKWQFMRELANYSNYIKDHYAYELVTANYSNGMLNGKATYIKKDNKSKEVLAKSSVTYHNNKIINGFEYISHDKGFTINIPLDFDGLPHGKSTIVYENGEYEDVSNWEHGILISRIHRNLSSGKVYIHLEANQNKLPFDSYEMEKLDSNWDFWGGFFFWTTHIPYDNIGSVSSENPMHIITRGIQTIRFKPFDLTRSNMLKNYQSHITNANHYYIQKDYANAISQYNEAQKLNKTDSVQNRIEDITRIFESVEFKKNNDLGDKYYKNKNFRISIKHFELALSFIKTDSIVNKLCKSYLSYGEFLLGVGGAKNSLHYFYKALDLSPDNVRIISNIKKAEDEIIITEADKLFEEGSYEAALKKYELLPESPKNTKFKEKKDSCIYYLTCDSLIIEVKKTNNKILKLYYKIETRYLVVDSYSDNKGNFVVNKVYSEHNSKFGQSISYWSKLKQGKDVDKHTKIITICVKEDLFNTYSNLYSQIIENYSTNRSVIEDFLIAQSQLLDLHDKKTKSLERIIRKAKTSEEVIELILEYK